MGDATRTKIEIEVFTEGNARYFAERRKQQRSFFTVKGDASEAVTALAFRDV